MKLNMIPVARNFIQIPRLEHSHGAQYSQVDNGDPTAHVLASPRNRVG